MVNKALILGLLLVGSTEKGCEKQIPKWKGKLYAGNSISGSIDRAQENEKISCMDSQFDQYICISKTDYDCFVETYVVNCKEWTKQSECGLK